MRKVIRNVLVACLAAIVAGFVFVTSGVYDIAATTPHWALTTWVLENIRTRSIRVHAAGIEVPVNLRDPAEITMGTEHFATHCAICHGAPGVPRDDIADGLYPRPPDLAQTATVYTSAQIFWILKHGIKMTGMPNWSDHGDDELWATVAFVEQLPGMTAHRYAGLVSESAKLAGRHGHGGPGLPASTDVSEHRSTGSETNANDKDMKGMNMEKEPVAQPVQ